MSSIFLGNSTREWIVAGGIAAAVYLALIVLRRILIRRLGALAERTDTAFDDAVVDVIKNTRAFFIAAVSIGAATRGLHIHDRLTGPLSIVLKLLVLFQIGLWIAGLISFLVKQSLTKRDGSSDRIGVAAVRAIGVTVKVVAWIILAIAALQFVFDRDVTAIIASLSIGGIAIALAVQNILGDVLAAIAIVFDRPFDVGDTIAIDAMVGKVEQIGLKTTRLRSVTGEQLVIGNAELLKAKLRNYKRMYERRAVITADVTYDTPPEMLERIPKIMKEIIEAQPATRFERSHFTGFGESALRTETVYFVLDPDYNRFMDIQQAVNLEILRRFTAHKISFAFPTTTLHVRGLSQPAAAAPPAAAPSPL